MDLKRLETELRTLIESQLIRALPGQKPEDRVARRFVEAMAAVLDTDTAGDRVAPNVYTLVIHPSSAGFWRDAQLLQTIAAVLNEAAAEAGARFVSPPSIALSPDPTSAPDEFHVVASHRISPMTETQEMLGNTPVADQSQTRTLLPEGAFLIVGGSESYELTRPVVNIGRRLDNDLVIDDPRISRHHAQLRAIDGSFVLFDLNSSGGTLINGQRKAQGILHPGDVISLAGVTLIYGHESSISPPVPSQAAEHGGSRPVTRSSSPTQ